jgi:tellurite resistance protein
MRLEGGFAALVVADADGFLDRAQEDFAVADVAGASGADLLFE